jgi:hypothetical protein
MKTSQKLWKLNKRSCVFVFRKNVSLRLVWEQRWDQSAIADYKNYFFIILISCIQLIQIKGRWGRLTDEIKWKWLKELE